MIDTGEEKLTLEDCIADFTKNEKLSQEESWYCPTCKDHKQASKKMDIWKTPSILVLHLKRFQNRGFWSGRKIQKQVECPDILDLTQFLQVLDPEKPPVYQLYAVANHYGATPTGGHYTAFCKNPVYQKWYYYDDAKVSEVSDKTKIVTEAAYLLFYVAKHVPNPLENFRTPELANVQLSEPKL